MKVVRKQHLISILSLLGLISLPQLAQASAFQIWEQDGASVGNYHAGYAAEANDASTTFYNPAGITRIKNQQVLAAATGAAPDVQYKGAVQVNTLNDNAPQFVTAQGGRFAVIPAFYYVYPFSERFGFGFGVNVPFGAEVIYGHSTALRYASTQSGLKVINATPALGIKVTDKASIGAGFDVQRMYGEFDQVGTLSGEELDSDGIDKADDTAYGFHVGGLYEFTPNTRAGVSYHSQVKHHLTGTSTFSGPLADFFDMPNLTSNSSLDITVPAYTALSVFHRFHPQFAVMASAIYTQWNVVRNIVLQNVAGLAAGTLDPSTNIVVTVPQNFRNTWNLSLGGNYYLNDQFTFRAGVGFDQSPVPSAYRTVSLPDNDRYAIAFGGHYQASKVVGLDLAWSHIFVKRSNIGPPPQVAGGQITTTSGHVTSGADLISGQVTWDIV